MTTDTRPKTTMVAGHGWSVGGMAKGAGMLAPGAGHDAVRADHRRGGRLRPRWTRCCARATAVTFDRVDSDGCLSTNDTVLLLASGASGIVADRGRARRRGHRRLPRPGPAAARRRRGVHEGRRDRGAGRGQRGRRGRGRPGGGPQQPGQDRAVRQRPELGPDPGRGRHHGGRFEPDELAVAVNGVWVCRAGAAAEDRSKVDLSQRAVHIVIDLGRRRRDRDDLDQRPVHRVRAREFGVLDMSASE